MSVPPADSFLVAQFREFYGEVLRLRQRVARGAWQPPAEGEGAGGETASEPPEPAAPSREAAPPERGGSGEELAPIAVWQRLLTLLERQALAARRGGGDFAGAVYGQAQYVMAALADETFLHLDWPGREAWKSHLLEAKLFGTHRAGELIFERLDALLGSHDPAYADLARVYLLALGLGFEGKFRGRQGGEADLALYRRKLYRFLARRDPRLAAGEERLVPQAYAATLDQGGGGQLPYLRPWGLAFALLLTVWVAAAHPLWRRLIDGLEVLLARILT